MHILFKRLLDPNLRSPNSWLLEDKIEGMNALVKAANKSENLITIKM